MKDLNITPIPLKDYLKIPRQNKRPVSHIAPLSNNRHAIYIKKSQKRKQTKPPPEKNKQNKMGDKKGKTIYRVAYLLISWNEVELSIHTLQVCLKIFAMLYVAFHYYKWVKTALNLIILDLNWLIILYLYILYWVLHLKQITMV